MLPDEIKPAMHGVIPSTLVTCSLAGVPNVTDISQVWYVDANHVALSFQFFNKTHRNIRENPFAAAIIRDPQSYQEWYLEIQYDHSEESGPLFDKMDAELEAIASMTGMSGIFELRAADVYRVQSVRKYKSRG
jgi:uncharacterized protein